MDFCTGTQHPVHQSQYFHTTNRPLQGTTVMTPGIATQIFIIHLAGIETHTDKVPRVLFTPITRKNSPASKNMD